MGRSSTKSVARVYADVMRSLALHGMNMVRNAALGILLVLFLTSLCFTDNLQVQWGSQDHYEIVRKVGRGKYPRCVMPIPLPSKDDLMAP